MRMFLCLCLLLPACASHTVRCDGRLQPINLPVARSDSRAAPRSSPVVAPVAAPRVAPGVAPRAASPRSTP